MSNQNRKTYLHGECLGKHVVIRWITSGLGQALTVASLNLRTLFVHRGDQIIPYGASSLAHYLSFPLTVDLDLELC